jgi:hypothetical protein
VHHRLALLGTTLALAVPIGAVAATPASAARYPSSVKKGFLKSCKKAAKGEGVSSKQAGTYCNASLKCLQRELSLKQFEQYARAVAKGDKTPPHNRKVKRCIEEAASKV